jgi:hypothetical protein
MPTNMGGGIRMKAGSVENYKDATTDWQTTLNTQVNVRVEIGGVYRCNATVIGTNDNVWNDVYIRVNGVQVGYFRNPSTGGDILYQLDVTVNRGDTIAYLTQRQSGSAGGQFPFTLTNDVGLFLNI